MRTFFRTLALALAVMLTVSTGSLLAQGNSQWKKVAIADLPAKVMTGYHRLFAHDKIQKVEMSKSGAVMYRLTIHRKGKSQEVIFDAAGRAQ